MYCIYCGHAREFWCRPCGEAHLVTAKEFYEYTGDWPEDMSDDEIEEQAGTDER